MTLDFSFNYLLIIFLLYFVNWFLDFKLCPSHSRYVLIQQLEHFVPCGMLDKLI